MMSCGVALRSPLLLSSRLALWLLVVSNVGHGGNRPCSLLVDAWLPVSLTTRGSRFASTTNHPRPDRPSRRSPFLLVEAPVTTQGEHPRRLPRNLRRWMAETRGGTSADGVGEEDDEMDFTAAVLPDAVRERWVSKEELEGLTVPQLKQQLRLRGLKVSGRKAELVDRFLQSQSRESVARVSFAEEDDTIDGDGEEERPVETKSAKGVDVSEFLEEDDRGKSFKSVKIQGEAGEEETEDENAPKEPEVWGLDARIVDDYEGRRVVVDCLSHTVVEYLGSNQSYVPALVVASRDALKPFLAGGRHPATRNLTSSPLTPAEERLREIQSRREKAARRPVHFEDLSGVDEGDEFGLYDQALHRDFSDWGTYTPTGARLSASEVQGVLLLPDVYGPFTNDTRALAEKIAFECQPVVVMVPDVFRGKPWEGPTGGVNSEGQTYEAWRRQHDDLRVSVDIRAGAACLRERYGVSSVVLWGTCYGGGRALEAAAGYLPGNMIHDVDGSIGPPPVDPMACIAWYPTRYQVDNLFGPDHQGNEYDSEGEIRKMAVMAIFAGNDKIPGATPKDAELLKEALEDDIRVRDHIVKIFPDQDHGFAHQGLGEVETQQDPFTRFVDDEFGGAGRLPNSDGDAEVACLLSTAFMETYSRLFLPTVGPPISEDEDETMWSDKLEMRDLSSTTSRDIRKEIEDAVDSFVEEPLGGHMIDPGDKSQEKELIQLMKSMESPAQKSGPFAIEDGDNLETIYAKLKAADENFQIF